MDAIVDGVIRLDPSALPPKALELLWRGLSFPNPEYLSRVRFGRWAGATPEEITLLERGEDGEVRLPRGAVKMLKEALAAAGASVSFVDRRVTREPVDYAFAFTLRDYQERGVQDLVRGVQGCVVIPCGGGKSLLGAAAIARLGQPAIILVHTNDLADQWRGVLRDALGLEAGLVTGGKVEPDVVTVAMVQTLASMETRTLEELARSFGVVIIDEAHHSPNFTFRTVLSAFPGRYRFGLTATPERADGLTPLLELGIGPVLFEIGHQELVDAGHLVVPQIEEVPTGCTPKGSSHTAQVAELCADPRRNRLLVDLAAREAAAGRSVLVLSGRVAHCETLAEALRGEGVTAEALTGRVPRRRRGEILGHFKSGEIAVVCATSLADEGLDVSRLERLILATPARAEGRTIQRLGRLMRPHPGKATPVLYDLVDDTALARRQFAARRRAYRKVLGGLDACALGLGGTRT